MTQSDPFEKQPFTFPPTLIDTRLALDFMLRYKRKRGKGNEIISTDIYKAVDKNLPIITRQRLDHWFSGRRSLTDDAFKTIFAFLRSEQFQRVVPEINSLLNARKRTIEQGQVMAEFEGCSIFDSDKILKKVIGGWAYDDDIWSHFTQIFYWIFMVPGENFALFHHCTESVYSRKIERSEALSKQGAAISVGDPDVIDEDGFLINSRISDYHSGFIFPNKRKGCYVIKAWCRIDREFQYRAMLRFDETSCFKSINTSCLRFWNDDPGVETREFCSKMDNELTLHQKSPRRKIIMSNKIAEMALKTKWSVIDYGSS